MVDLIRCLQQEATREKAVAAFIGRVFVRSGGGCDNTADPADVCRRCETP
ncbi:hypothetical protein [Phocaeicola coprocola]